MQKALAVSLSLSALAVGVLFLWSPGSPQGLLSSVVRNSCTIDTLYGCTEPQLEELEYEYTALEQVESNLTRQMEINRDEIAKLQTTLSSYDSCIANSNGSQEIIIMLEQIAVIENTEKQLNEANAKLARYEASQENTVAYDGQKLTIEALRKAVNETVSSPISVKAKNANNKKIAANNRIIDGNNRKITANNRKITANDNKEIATRNRIATNYTKIATNNSAIEKFESSIDVAKKQKNNRSVTQLNTKISNLRKQNTTFTNQNTVFTNQNTTLENQNSTLKNQNTTLENQNSTLKNQNTTLTVQSTQDGLSGRVNTLRSDLSRLTSTPAYIQLTADVASKTEEFLLLAGPNKNTLTTLRESVKNLQNVCEVENFSSLDVDSREALNEKLTAEKNKGEELQEKDRNRGNFRGNLESIKYFLNELRNNRQAREQEDMLERERQQQDTIICEGGKVETRDYNGKVVGCICPFHCQEENNGQCGNWVGKTLGEAARDVFLDNIPFLGGNHDTKSISVDTNPDTGGLGEIATGRESEFGRVWENCV
ncbi:hypothetical protein KA050_04115 [Candidatus Gracilibacteria bacterium]|nr:hypothetical protein [Candidatus Gracilibacteria bacterium]